MASDSFDLPTALDAWLASLGSGDEDLAAALSVHTLKLYRTASGNLRRWWQEQLEAPRSPEAPAPVFGNTTLADWVRSLRRAKLADRTVQSYAESLSSFVAYVAEEELAPLSPDLVRRHLRRALPAYSIPSAPEVADLRQLVGWYDNPQPPSEPNPLAERTYLTGLRNAALLHLLFSTGMRIGEALSLDAAQIRGRGNAIRDKVEVLGKGRKRRRVFIRPHAQQALERYLTARQERFASARPLFISHGPRAAGGRLNPSTAWRIVTEAATSLADQLEPTSDQELVTRLRAVTPHTFRHFVATWLLNEGAQLSEVSALLGHSSTTITEQYYARHDDARLQELHDTFAPDPESR